MLLDYLYPIVWWTVLPVLDTINFRFRGCSLWRDQPGRFFGLVLPVSVLFWVLFEALNLAAPQWRYAGAIQHVPVQVLFGFAAFSTVIPIVVEVWWLIAGSFCLPASAAGWLRSHAGLSVAAAAAAILVPLFNDIFWFNQGMWLAPALVLLPFLRLRECPGLFRFGLQLSATGLLSGFLWECFNWASRTHWEYLILPDWPHLFQMPLPGYLGFIPFSLSCLAVYDWLRRWQPRLPLVLALYGAVFALLWPMTLLYIRYGLWVFL